MSDRWLIDIDSLQVKSLNFTFVGIGPDTIPSSAVSHECGYSLHRPEFHRWSAHNHIFHMSVQYSRFCIMCSKNWDCTLLYTLQKLEPLKVGRFNNVRNNFYTVDLLFHNSWSLGNYSILKAVDVSLIWLDILHQEDYTLWLFVGYVSWNMKTNFPCRKFHQCIQTNKYLAREHRHTRSGYTRTVDEQVVLRTRDSDSRSLIKQLRSLTLQLEPKPALPIQPGSQ